MRTFQGRFCAGLIAIGLLVNAGNSALAAETAQPQTPTVQDVATVIGENAIHYPQLSGMADEKYQQSINDAIVEKANIAQRMVTLSTLQAGGSGLQVTYKAYLKADIFSTVISAKGILENGRSGQVYTALNYDLQTGTPLSISDLFTDTDAAVAAMEQILQSTYLDELSSYMENSDLTPLPTEQFSLDANGITFYYPYRQFALLSGYSGAAQFAYHEISEFLRTDAGGVPARLDMLAKSYTDEETRALIEQDARTGVLSDVPVQLGESMQPLIDQNRLLRVPDRYPGGRYCQLEAPVFRRVLILTDELSNTFEQSVVQGIMSFRADWYGIKTGATEQKRWREILGQAENTVAFTDSMAYDYGLLAGTADYYSIGGHQVMLYADADQLLYAIRLTQ